MSLARRLAVIAALSAPLLLVGTGNHGFWYSDEPFVAEIGREMAASGDWVVPRLNGRPFLEKPPLQPATVAISFRLFGLTPFAARLPSMVAVLLTILATYRLGLRLFDERTAFWGALVYPTISQVFVVAHYCVVDPWLALFVTAGFLAATFAAGADRRRWAIPAVYLSAALAFLTKGLVGPGLIGLGVAAYGMFREARGLASARGHLLGAVIAAAVVGSWVVALAGEGGAAFLREALVVNTIGRYVARSGLVPAGDAPGLHVEPFWFYAENLPANFLPWTPLLLTAAAAGAAAVVRRRADPSPALAAGEARAWVLLLPGLLAVSGASAKRGVYLLPLYPLLALLAAHHARRLAASASPLNRVERFLLAAQAGVALALGWTVAGGYVYLSGPIDGSAADPRGLAVGLALALLSAGVTALAWRSWRRGRRASCFRWLWAQTAAALLAFSILCVPAMDPIRSDARFYDEAVRLERDRGRIPLLFSDHEALIGYAGLAFRRTLPRLTMTPDGPLPPPGAGPCDVLTDESGVTALRSAPGIAVTVLLPPVTGSWDEKVSPYLVSIARRSG